MKNYKPNPSFPFYQKYFLQNGSIVRYPPPPHNVRDPVNMYALGSYNSQAVVRAMFDNDVSIAVRFHRGPVGSMSPPEQ